MHSLKLRSAVFIVFMQWRLINVSRLTKIEGNDGR